MELLRLENNCSELRLGFLSVFFVGTTPVAYRMIHSQIAMAIEPTHAKTLLLMQSWAGERELVFLEPEVVLRKIFNLLALPVQKKEFEKCLNENICGEVTRRLKKVV